MDDSTAAQWFANYGKAWVERDAALAVSIFSADAEYHQTPFGPHYKGADEIGKYWVEITEHERDVIWQAGTPLVFGQSAACEWWVTMTENGEPTTLPGCVIVTLDEDGRCVHLREYWHQLAGTHPAYPGWGRLDHGDASR
jgi:SnoaL-like domain